MRHPLPLAKELATLQNLSKGRLILGAGVGWLEAEFDALGVPFKERGRRMDEGIAMMKAVWSQDPVTFPTKYIPAVISDMRSQPQPVKPIPIWIGGSSDAAINRALRLDGWHGSRVRLEAAADVVKRLPRPRVPGDSDFTISIRININETNVDDTRGALAAYEAAGIQHVMAAPEDREIDAYMKTVDRFVKAGRGSVNLRGASFPVSAHELCSPPALSREFALDPAEFHGCPHLPRAGRGTCRLAWSVISGNCRVLHAVGYPQIPPHPSDVAAQFRPSPKRALDKSSSLWSATELGTEPVDLAGRGAQPRHEIGHRESSHARIVHLKDIAARRVVRVLEYFVDRVDRPARHLRRLAQFQQIGAVIPRGPGADRFIHLGAVPLARRQCRSNGSARS